MKNDKGKVVLSGRDREAIATYKRRLGADKLTDFAERMVVVVKKQQLPDVNELVRKFVSGK